MHKPPRLQGRAGVEALARSNARMRHGDHKGTFHHRLSSRVADSIVDAGIEMPEQLLFMTDAEVRALKGVGPAALKEVQAYRARFVPSS